MRTTLIVLLITIIPNISFAQIDTISPASQKLLTKKVSSSRSTYLVYWEDEHGNITGSAELWKRELQTDNDQYRFDWKWYRNDSLYAHIRNTGNLLTMEPKLHHADYFQKGKFTVQFKDVIVSIPDSAQTKESHKSFKVQLQPTAFAFPMDLEILPLLPIQRVGQQFSIAFYEPGAQQSAYYNATIIKKEKLVLPADQKVLCWVLRLNYAPDSYADFWIDSRSGGLLKMKEFYNGKYRYKIKLY